MTNPLTEQEWESAIEWVQAQLACADLGEEAEFHRHMAGLVLRGLQEGRRRNLEPEEYQGIYYYPRPHYHAP